MKTRKNKSRPARETKLLPSIFRFSKSQEIELQLIPHQELDKIRSGDGNEESWNTIAVRVNVGAMMANLYFNQEAQDAMQLAVNSISALAERMKTTGRLVMTGDEFRYISTALNLTDDMQVNTTKREQAEAMRKVYDVATVEGRKNIGDLIAI